MQQDEQSSAFMELIKHPCESHSIIKLMQFSTLLQQQLPLMPYDHMAKLILDEDNKCLLLRIQEQTIGGICYNIDSQLSVSKIQLMAISGDYHLQGYGSSLMNNFKHLMQQQGIKIIATMADNKALTFYQKQGFKPQNQQAQEQPSGLQPGIYTNSTAMIFTVSPRIDYLGQKQKFKKQAQFVYNLMKDQTNPTHHTLNISPDCGKYQKVKKGKIKQYDINPIEIQGILSNGWSEQEMNNQQSKQAKRQQQDAMQLRILEQLMQNAYPCVRQIPEQLMDLNALNMQGFVDISSLNQQIQQDKLQPASISNFQQETMQMLNNCEQIYQSDPNIAQNVANLKQLFATALANKVE